MYTASRICPGQRLGSRTVWLAATRILWAFSVGPAFDADGVRVPVDPNECTSGMTS